MSSLIKSISQHEYNPKSFLSKFIKKKKEEEEEKKKLLIFYSRCETSVPGQFEKFTQEA